MLAIFIFTRRWRKEKVSSLQSHSHTWLPSPRSPSWGTWEVGGGASGVVKRSQSGTYLKSCLLPSTHTMYTLTPYTYTLSHNIHTHTHKLTACTYTLSHITHTHTHIHTLTYTIHSHIHSHTLHTYTLPAYTYILSHTTHTHIHALTHTLYSHTLYIHTHYTLTVTPLTHT